MRARPSPVQQGLCTRTENAQTRAERHRGQYEAPLASRYLQSSTERKSAEASSPDVSAVKEIVGINRARLVLVMV
jgi:hypothetical protein